MASSLLFINLECLIKTFITMMMMMKVYIYAILEDPGAVSRVERKGDTSFQGAPSPVVENFRRAFSSDPTNCPWVSEDGPTLMKCK